MSNNAILFGIGRLKYEGRITGHGFRALAISTIKEKLDYRHEVVDRQPPPLIKIDRAYDRAKFLDHRTRITQEWTDLTIKQLWLTIRPTSGVPHSKQKSEIRLTWFTYIIFVIYLGDFGYSS